MYAHSIQVDDMVSKALFNCVNLASLHIKANNYVMVSMALGTVAWVVQLCHAAYIHIIER